MSNKLLGRSSIQRLAVLYIAFWAIAPVMELGLRWRLLALACALLWFGEGIAAGVYRAVDKKQVLALLFAVIAAIIGFVEGGFSGVLKQIAVYILVIGYLIFRYYADRGSFEELRGVLPLILASLVYFNIRSTVAVIADPTILRRIVRDDAETYAYLRSGIGGYGLLYSQVMLFPAGLAWIRGALRRNRLLFALGSAWAVSFVLLVLNAGYSIAVVGAAIGAVMLLFYRRRRVGGAVLVSLLLFAGLMASIVYIEPWRGFLLEFFSGTSVAVKIRDLTASAANASAEGSIQNRITAYRYSVEAILGYPFIGGLWMAGGGGHSQLLDMFAKYGVWGGAIFVMAFYSVPVYFRSVGESGRTVFVSNATLTVMVFVSLLDSCTYAVMGSVFFLLPLLFTDIIAWEEAEDASSLDGEPDTCGAG